MCTAPCHVAARVHPLAHLYWAKVSQQDRQPELILIMQCMLPFCCHSQLHYTLLQKDIGNSLARKSLGGLKTPALRKQQVLRTSVAERVVLCKTGFSSHTWTKIGGAKLLMKKPDRTAASNHDFAPSWFTRHSLAEALLARTSCMPITHSQT